ncbi:MAG TPA: DUF6600 domain-containing protein [Candidatus Sulfotelmatobacter sp.]|nr:DUF6600 domain-containing protein [Candidatus Sulfotelmatobacter sp.]
MKSRKLWTWLVLFASFAFLLQLSSAIFAQNPDAQSDGGLQNTGAQNADAQNTDAQNNGAQDSDDQAQDPPGRVGRLNYSQGSISFRPAGEDDWVTAVPNRPMVSGDDLWADDNSRAEVHIGSTVLRLGTKTGITFLALDDRTTQIRLAQGTLFLRVRHIDDDDSYEVDTPNLAFTLLQPGEYRIDVSADGSQTLTTVWQGRGRVTGGGLTYTVVANQQATFNGNQDHLDYDLGQIPQRDDFDTWAFDRDSREDRADSANYVSREMTGYEDLDEYGDWSYVAGYGPCWRPRAIAGGWAPYRFGHWAYVGPWGWTWVEDEPWGFAPFHYGRWAFVSNGWFWVPGPVVVRPVWAPALVAFVGGGPGFRFSGGVGVGWFPLAPGEVFVPGYHVSRGYVNNVNITNTTVNITKVTNVYNTVIVNKTTTINNITYVNQRVNNGVTVVSHDAFVNARPVNQNLMRVDQREVASAPVSRVAGAEPIRTSVIGAGRPVSVRPPAAIIQRQVVAVHTPATLPRPIDQRQAQAGGRLNEQSLVRPAGPTRPATQTNQGNQGRAQQTNDGFRSFTPPNGGNHQQPRTLEQQGSAENQNRSPEAPQNRMQPTNRDFHASQQTPASQEANPRVRPTPPVQERTPQQEQQQEQKFNQWHQQRTAAPPQQSRQEQSRPEPKPSAPPKKDR